MEFTPDPSKLADWIQIAVLFSMEITTDYSMRFVSVCRAYPRRMMWLILKPHNEYCEDRKLIAQELLTFTELSLDPFCHRLRLIFVSALRIAANTGCLDYRLWLLLETIAQQWKMDTQEIEGVNNIIKYLMALCPALAWELLASRITIKKECADHKSPADREYLVTMCVDHHDDTVRYMATHNAERFEELNMSKYPVPPHWTDYKTTKVSPGYDHVAVAGFWARLQGEIKAMSKFDFKPLGPSAQWAIKVTHDLTDELNCEYYYISMSYRRQLWIIAATEHADGDDGRPYEHDEWLCTCRSGVYLQTELPLKPKRLLDVFAWCPHIVADYPHHQPTPGPTPTHPGTHPQSQAGPHVPMGPRKHPRQQCKQPRRAPYLLAPQTDQPAPARR